MRTLYFEPSPYNIEFRMSCVRAGIKRMRNLVKFGTPASDKQYSWWKELLQRRENDRDYYMRLLKRNGGSC